MSATRDKSQKFTFVYSNLYQIYKKERATTSEPVAESAKTALPRQTSHVLKTGDLSSTAAPQIREYNPTALIGRRVVAAEPVVGLRTAIQPANPAIDSLKENLKALNNLHARLRFMLQELEELVKE